MSEKKPFQDMSEMMKNFGEKTMDAFNKESLMKSHQSNLEALNEASRMAMDVMKSIATLQSQYIRQTFEDMSKMMKETMGQPLNENTNPKEVFSNHAGKIKDHVARTFDHTANISNIIAQSQREMLDRMHERYQEGASEVINVAKKAQTKH